MECAGGISTFTSPNSRQMLTIVIVYAISWIVLVIFFIDDIRLDESLLPNTVKVFMLKYFWDRWPWEIDE